MVPVTDLLFQECDIEDVFGDVTADDIKELQEQWKETNIDVESLLDDRDEEDFYEDDLKPDSNPDVSFDSNNNADSEKADDDDDCIKKPEAKNVIADNSTPTSDGPPDDIRAFYGHPLTAATAAVNEDDTHASAVALLHEYINLPALDKSGMKIGDKINSIYDIMRDDGASTKVVDGVVADSVPDTSGEYMQMLQTTLASEVDKFFNRNCVENTVATSDVVLEHGSVHCPVSIAEEVIHEVCIETSCMNSDGADKVTPIFQSVSDAVPVLQSTPPPPRSIVGPEGKVLTLAMPNLDDMPNEAPTPACSATSSITAAVPVSINARVPAVSNGRKSREAKSQGTEKSQELSKKLVKALTEKILKRMNQKSEQVVDKCELDAAVSTLTSVNNAETSVHIDHVISESIDVSSTTVVIDESHESILEGLPENLPIIEASNLDASPVPLTSYSPMTPHNPHHIRSTQLTSISSQTHIPNQTGLTLPVSIPPSPSIVDASSCSQTPTNSRHLHNMDCVQSVPSNLITKHPQYMKTNSVPNGNSHPNCYTSDTGNPTAAAINQCTIAGNAVGGTGAQGLPPMYYYPGTTNPQAPFMFPAAPQSPRSPERDVMLERYIQQQNQYFHHEHPGFQYTGTGKEAYSLKSPDSGYGEPCVSPRDHTRNQVQYTDHADSDPERHAKVAKRRKSAPPMYVKQFWQPLPVDKYDKYAIAKLEVDPAGYKYFLETPISTTQKIEQDRITYLNKGQYYSLTLEYNGERPLKVQTVKTLIMVVFREDKHLDDEHKAWEFWHSRQHSYKQRVIDIDTKNSVGVNPSSTEEISFNAVAVKWNPRDSPVKVNIAVHCLSTDFSNQKGVKGLPLHVQIDTFETSTKDSLPISRGYCQIKVFCDKGAERKTRDEERRKQCRVKHETPPSVSKTTRKRTEDVFHESCERSQFYPMADLQTRPILFSPSFDCADTNMASPINLTVQDEDGSSSITSSGDHYDSSEDRACPPPKRARIEPPITSFPAFSNILIYVREKHEVVFTAVMLRSPTLHGLLKAVEEKYNVPVSKITNSYKRSKKGILVRMDDNIIRHYSHESTFIIELNQEGQGFELILTEIDPN